MDLAQNINQPTFTHISAALLISAISSLLYTSFNHQPFAAKVFHQDEVSWSSLRFSHASHASLAGLMGATEGGNTWLDWRLPFDCVLIPPCWPRGGDPGLH